MSKILDILREQKEMNLKGNLYHITQVNFAYNTDYVMVLENILKEFK